MAENKSSPKENSAGSLMETTNYFRKTRCRLPASLRIGIIALMGGLLAYGVFYGLRELGY